MFATFAAGSSHHHSKQHPHRGRSDDVAPTPHCGLRPCEGLLKGRLCEAQLVRLRRNIHTITPPFGHPLEALSLVRSRGFAPVCTRGFTPVYGLFGPTGLTPPCRCVPSIVHQRTHAMRPYISYLYQKFPHGNFYLNTAFANYLLRKTRSMES
jgi:hypothetical protein